jgi:four helix bundle protein
MGRVRSFRELDVYRNGFRLAMEVYRVSGDFPADERFGLTAQIRRSSRSVCANTAEAWRRRRYPAAFIAKLNDAEAEAAETRVHLDFARACGYMDPATHGCLDRRYDRLLGQLVRMIHSAPQWTIGRSSPPPRPPRRVRPDSPPQTDERRSTRPGSPSAGDRDGRGPNPNPGPR